MPGFSNNTMYAYNVDFRGVTPVAPQMVLDGQLLIGASVFPFIRAANLTSANGSITITNGPGTIDLSGTLATTTQIGSMTFATNAETIAGAVTTKATTPDDIKAKLGTQTLHGIAYGGGNTSAISWLAAATNGQIPIGSTGNAPVLAQITSSGGTITFTFGAGTINAEVTTPSVAFLYTDQATSSTVVSNHGYFVTAASMQTLPASPSQGDRVVFIADTSGSVVIQANTGQQIRTGSSISSIAGTATNAVQGDSISLRYRSANSTWISESGNGAWQTA